MNSIDARRSTLLPFGLRRNLLQSSSRVLIRQPVVAIMVFVNLLFYGGCTAWNAPNSSSAPRLPMAHMSSQSIGVEIATVTLQPDQAHLLSDIFSRLDEQVIAPEIRQTLVDNGFRAGLLGVQLPEPIIMLLMEAADRRRHPTAETQPYLDEQRFVQCRAQKSVPTKLWGVRDLTTRFRNGEVTSVEEMSQAECLLNVFGVPQRNAGAAIRLIPEVAHGPIRQKYVVQDNAFHMEARRDRRTYHELAIELVLRPGEVLMVTCDTEPTKSLGRDFFLNGNLQKLLLIRLTQTQIDDFFDDFNFSRLASLN